MVVPHYAYSDSQVLGVLNDVGNPCVNVCYSCLILRLHVCVFGCLVCGSSTIAMIIDFIDVSRWENPKQW